MIKSFLLILACCFSCVIKAEVESSLTQPIYNKNNFSIYYVHGGDNKEQNTCYLYYGKINKPLNKITLAGHGALDAYNFGCGVLSSSSIINNNGTDVLLLSLQLYAANNSFVVVRAFDINENGIIDNEILSKNMACYPYEDNSIDQSSYISFLAKLSLSTSNKICSDNYEKLFTLKRNTLLYIKPYKKSKLFLMSGDKVYLYKTIGEKKRRWFLIEYEQKPNKFIEKWIPCQALELCEP